MKPVIDPSARWCAALLLGASVVAGCAADRMALRTPDQEQQDLETRATSYWTAVRWADVEGASAFVEPADLRQTYHLWLQDQLEQERVTEATVVRVELGERQATLPTEGPLMTAQVTVRTEGYRVSDQRLKKDDLTQTWYRNGDGWYVEWSP